MVSESALVPQSLGHIDMRISVHRDDPGYFRDTSKTIILVNGLDVAKRCYTADEEEGKAYCFKHDEKGKVYIDPDNPNQAAQEILEGKVEIFPLGKTEYNS